MTAVRTRVSRAAADPGHFLGSVLSLLKGRWYLLKYRLLRKRLQVGRNFRVYGKLDLRGPGEVIFGNDTMLFQHVRVWTRTRKSRVVFGDHLAMESTRFGSADSISVGRGCKLGPAYIMDTNFHSTHANRRDPQAPVRVAPVRIGDNVWIGYGAGVLAGVSIGNDSVVAFGTVCHSAVPAGVIVAGNPARIVGAVPGAASTSPINDMFFEEQPT